MKNAGMTLTRWNRPGNPLVFAHGGSFRTLINQSDFQFQFKLGAQELFAGPLKQRQFRERILRVSRKAA